MNEIIVAHGVRGNISKAMRVSLPTIRKALRGQSKSLLSLKIRQAALNSGGIEVARVKNTQKVVRL